MDPDIELISNRALVNNAVNRNIFFSPTQIEGWLIVFDLLAVLGATIIPFFVSEFILRSESPHFTVILVGCVMIIIMNKAFHLYDFNLFNNKPREIRLVTASVTLAFLFIGGMYFSYHGGVMLSRLWVVSWYLSCLGGVLVCRRLSWRIMRRMASAGHLVRRIALVGTGKQTDRLLQVLTTRGDPWIEIVGIYDDRNRSRADGSNERRSSGGLWDLKALCRQGGVDDVIIALPWSADDRILAIASQLSDFPVHVRTAPDLINFAFGTLDLQTFSGMTTLDLTPHPLNSAWAMVKAIEDYLIAGTLILVLAPVMAAIAVAIKCTSPGPVIYRQKRHGFNNRTFTVFKFRTMYHNPSAEIVTRQATRRDPRVTPIGALLRRTSLDELPQLFNVLQGTMSLVGPRPHAVDQNEAYGDLIQRYLARHRVKPGITGWAQVNGFRGETDTQDKMQKRIEHDISYIENWSPLLDLVIIAKTALVFLNQKNAY